MIPPSLRPKMWKHSYGNRRHYGALASGLAGLLYPENQMSYIEICRSMGEIEHGAKKRIRVTLYRLKKGGLVDQTSCRRYFLTDPGRWFAISHKLGLSFLELCMLANACCIDARYARSGKQGFYLHSYFEKIFTEYYCKGHVSNLFSLLVRKGFAARHAKKTIRVIPRIREDLMARYGPYFGSLESWLDSIEGGEVEIFQNALEGFSRERHVRK